MSKYTENYNLVQLEENEHFAMEHINHNMKILDKEVGDIQADVDLIKEGNRIAMLSGCYGFGGYIQDPGIKNQNYIYYDRNTKKMYKCLKQTSYVSASVANFVPLDNNTLLNRLENLLTINGMTHPTIEIKCDTVNCDSSKTLIKFPTPFNNECASVVVSDRYGTPTTFAIGVKDKYGFEVYFDNGSVVANSFCYLAIGY